MKSPSCLPLHDVSEQQLEQPAQTLFASSKRRSGFMQVLLLLLVVFCFVTNGANAQRLHVKLGKLPEGVKPTQVFAAGNFNGWNPADTAFRFNESGMLLVNLNSRTSVAFKCTLGNWQTVEVQADGSDVGNREVTLLNDTLYLINITAFKSAATTSKQSTASPRVLAKTHQVFFPSLGYQKNIRIYLPPNYHKSQQRYPVLYMHDGQNLFDASIAAFGEWNVDETLDSLFRKNKTGVIVIGIDHGNEKRISEYMPYSNEKYNPANGKKYIYDLVNVLKPFVDKQFRTKPDVGNTWIAGSSMGGLISAYAVLAYPNTFGKAGVFSPSFWINPRIITLAKSTKAGCSKPNALYLYAGTKESEKLVAEVEQFKKALPRCIRQKAVVSIQTNGTHSETSWRKAFSGFVQHMLHR